MSTTEATPPTGLEVVEHAGSRISAADPVYGEVLDFLYDEAALLDDDRYTEWTGLLTDDIRYRMPARKTLYRRDGHGFDSDSNHFDDDAMSIMLRVKRSAEIVNAYDRDPAPRMRRFVTNLVLHHGATADEYEATTNFQITRNRFAEQTCEVLTAKREDVIRRTADGLRLQSRLILADQTSLAAIWVNVFM